MFSRCLLVAFTTALAGSVFLIAPAEARKLPPGTTAVTAVEGIEEYRLANGLQLLLVPDDSKPTTTVNMTVRVGSRQENTGETGMAHLLEHMLFKGTPRHPKVWADFEKRGLAANGSTSFDRTNYTASFSASEDNLNWYVGWLADALVNSYVARKDLDTEMTVVRNEMEQGENSPERTLYKKTLGVMFDWHPYGRDTIGARADVENVDIPRLQAFYRQYYQPDNTTLIVSGRFEPDKLLAQVAQTFGRLAKPTRKLPNSYTLDPAQDGERSVTLRRVGGTPVLFAGYHGPAAADPASAATDVLTLVMGDTPSGRLHKRLVDAQLAAGSFAFSPGLAEPGFMIFGAQLAPGQDVERARVELLATLESAVSEPLRADEVERAKTKWLKQWDQAFTNPEVIGNVLSETIAQGDWRLFFLQRDRVRAVSLTDVQRAATERLLPSNRTLASYVPSDKPLRAPEPAKVDVAAQLREFKPQAAGALVAPFEATPENIERRTQRFTLGGLQAAVLSKPTRGGVVHAQLTLRFGDAQSLNGLAEVRDSVAAMLDKGTRTLSREQIQDRLDQLQTEVGFGSGTNSLTVSITSRRAQLPAALALVTTLLREPAFPPGALDEIKRQSLASVEQQRKQPEALADNALQRMGNPYPRGDLRYAQSFDEMAADVQAVRVEQLRDFHARFYGARQAEFAAVGDVDIEALRQALQPLSQWDSGVPYAHVPVPIVPIPPQRVVIPVGDNQNATLMMRLAVPLADSDADYPALMMANHLLGAGGNSRLWRRIREGEGLSYDVRGEIGWNNQEPHSEWQGSAIFAPQNLARVEAAFKEELARALRDGFTAQELAEGQRGLLNFRRLGRAQDAAIAAQLAANLHLGRTMALSARVDDALAKLTVAQVNAALRKYIAPERFIAAAAGDFKELKP